MAVGEGGNASGTYEHVAGQSLCRGGGFRWKRLFVHAGLGKSLASLQVVKGCREDLTDPRGMPRPRKKKQESRGRGSGKSKESKQRLGSFRHVHSYTTKALASHPSCTSDHFSSPTESSPRHPRPQSSAAFPRLLIIHETCFIAQCRHATDGRLGRIARPLSVPGDMERWQRLSAPPSLTARTHGLWYTSFGSAAQGAVQVPARRWEMSRASCDIIMPDATQSWHQHARYK